MGLDQYAFARKGEPIKTTKDVTYTDFKGVTRKEQKIIISYDEELEISYWRKHPNLQGWMEDLWYEKGNEGQFNCVDVELTLEDLDALEQSLDDRTLPKTAGFFFGDDSDDCYAEQDREFILAARNNIKNGYKIVYTSWW